MKRVLLRPGKTVIVSDDALARARAGMKAFGATPEAMAKLSSFKGETTIGPKRAGSWVFKSAHVGRTTVHATAADTKKSVRSIVVHGTSGCLVGQNDVLSSKRKLA